MKLTARSLLLISCFLFLASNLISQKVDRLNLFLDCNYLCDYNYIKQEIDFVDYSLERLNTHVYIMVTELSNGGGGSEVQMVFQGNKEFQNQNDTTFFNIDPNAMEGAIREQIVSELKKGLLPFLVQTSMRDQITFEISGTENSEEDSEETDHDPWNYWVFNVGGNGWANGEQASSSINLRGNFRASRVTDKNKFRLNVNANLNNNTFNLLDGEVIKTTVRGQNIFSLYVKSLNEHWSIGAIGEAGSSTFSNMDFSGSLKPAIEYNIFPYEEAQTKRLTTRYSIGPDYFDYTDTTIYNQTEELVYRHGLDVEFSTTQKMGDLYFNIGARQYLHNLNLYNIFFNPGASWQLFKGFRVNLNASISFVTDRINIPRSNLTDEDILLDIRQVDTAFSYWTSFGINYRFGSQKNNFVNVRF